MSTAFGPGATDKARNAATAAVAEVKAGKAIFNGPIKSKTGNIVIEKSYGLYAPFLDRKDYLINGVNGSLWPPVLVAGCGRAPRATLDPA